MTNPLTLLSVAGLLMAGAAVPAIAMEDDEGANAIDRLMQQFEQSVEDATHQVTFLPLVPVNVVGHTADGRVERISIYAQATASMRLQDLVIIDGVDRMLPDVTVERDADGSMEDGVANKGDLIRLSFDLHAAMHGGEQRVWFLDSPAARSGEWTIKAPKNLGPSLVELTVLSRSA